MSDGSLPLPDSPDAEIAADTVFAAAGGGTAGTSHAGPHHCLNCGHEAAGEFCPACGQKRIHDGDLGVKHAWHHVLHETLHVDGKIFNTIKVLFTKPGQLALDFFDGRRARHVHPVRLFLIFGLLFFFFARVHSPVDLRNALKMQFTPTTQNNMALISARLGLTADQFINRVNDRMNALFKTADIVAIVLHGFWLWLMYRRRRRYLAENMVIALHLACFSMTLWLTIGSLHFLGVGPGVISLLMLPLSIGYFLLTARRVYGGHWLANCMRWLVLQVSTMVVISGAFVFAFFGVLREASAQPVTTAVKPAAPAEALVPKERISLFDGRSLLGWTFVARNAATDPAETWAVKDGVIACTGKPNGYARTIATYRDYVLTAEWRWPDKPGNSGLFVHLNPPDKVWPACLEVQLRGNDAGSVRANGASKVRELDPNAKDPINVALRGPVSEKPAGEWNRCEVICRGDTITISINGVQQNVVTGASLTSGSIALQAEGAPIEFRKIEIAPLPAP